MALSLWGLNLTSAPGVQSNREAVSLLVAALVLPWLAWVAQRVGQFRAAYAEQKRVLTHTLTRLGELKTHDPLTGLTDHHHMQALLGAECKRHSRNGLPFSLALLAIEQQQQINAQYGAAQGDAVIRQLGQLAVQHLRMSDVVARWSSHEFLILMPETDLHGAHRSVERLREYLSTRWGFYSEGRWVPMDCSVGVTHLRAADTITLLLQRVEQALSDARRMAQNTTKGKP
jgi:diguanylate cyclase (GGDEF)-like protein